MEFGLSRITRLVREYNKVLPWKAFHIAGTNGKGGTSAFLSGLLHKAGRKVGRFNSPHLLYRHDCISINEETIPKLLFDDVEKEIKKRDEDLGTKATPFELLTATAFEAFNRAEVDFGVVECGLGGTHDATNVLLPEEALCSIITRIGFDHQNILGKSLIDIAEAKAGILKPQVPAIILADNRRDVSEVITKQATKLKSHYVLSSYNSSPLGHPLELIKTLDMPLPMLSNLAMAYDAYSYVSKRRPLLLPALSPDEVLDIAKSVRKSWRGRAEWMSIEESFKRKAPILIDGAHNPQAMGVLRAYLDQNMLHKYNKSVPITWVFAASKGKEYPEMFRRLFQPEDTIIMTEFSDVDGMPWVEAEAAWRLKDYARTNMASYTKHHRREQSQGNIFSYPITSQALLHAVKVTPETSPIVVTGSLYLVGTVLRLLEMQKAKEKNEDPDEEDAVSEEIDEESQHGTAEDAQQTETDAQKTEIEILKAHLEAVKAELEMRKAEEIAPYIRKVAAQTARDVPKIEKRISMLENDIRKTKMELLKFERSAGKLKKKALKAERKEEKRKMGAEKSQKDTEKAEKEEQDN